MTRARKRPAGPGADLRWLAGDRLRGYLKRPPFASVTAPIHNGAVRLGGELAVSTPSRRILRSNAQMALRLRVLLWAPWWQLDVLRGHGTAAR